jgi:hypothetical protein
MTENRPLPNPPVPLRRIEQAIIVIRGHRVMLGSDLAELYGVPARRLNEQVKRNRDRFPDDFMFQLTSGEWRNLKSQIATSSWGGARRALPYAFTEQSGAMLSSVLRSKRAVQVNVEVMRTFVRLRRILAGNAVIARAQTPQNRLRHRPGRQHHRPRLAGPSATQTMTDKEPRPNLCKSVGSADDVPVSGPRSSVAPTRHVVNQYVIRARRRNELQAYLKDKGIGTEVYTPLPLHLQECFVHLGYKPGDFPESEKAAQESLALPVFPELGDAQALHVVDSCRAFYAL